MPPCRSARWYAIRGSGSGRCAKVRAMSADLAADTAVRADPDTPGRYHIQLPDHWDFLMPSGGVAMTCALRAAVAEIGDPALRFASATTIFCTPIKHGSLVSDVVVL